MARLAPPALASARGVRRRRRRPRRRGAPGLLSSRAAALLSPLVALAITVAVGAVLFAALGKPPARALAMFFVEPLRDGRALSELAIKATPLAMIALGLAIAFRANVWNIGAEGQFITGAIAATGVVLLAGPGVGRWVVVALLVAGVAWAAWRGRRWSRGCAIASRPTRSWSA